MSTLKKANLANSEFINFILKWTVAPIALAITTFLIYFPSLKYPFQFDDSANILKFYNIRHLTLSDLFFNSSRWIIFWLNTINYKLAKFDPLVYRLFNVTFHVITGILIYYLISFLLSKLKNNFYKNNSFYIAFLTSAMFLLHPVQTQTVSYVIQGQLEGLATLFVLSIVCLFVLSTQIKNSVLRTFTYSMTFLLAFLSTGTKEIAIVSPLLLIIVDWFFIAQGNFKDFKKRIYFHSSIFVFVVGIYAYLMKPQFFLSLLGFNLEAKNNIGNLLNSDFNQPITAWQFFISQFKVILHYFAIFIWPFSLCVDYDWKLVQDFGDIDCFLPFIGVLAIIGLTFYLFKKNKTSLTSFGLLWFLICLAPRASIVPSSEIMADYKTYLASVGLIFLLASLLVYLVLKIKNYLISKNYNLSENTNFILINIFIALLAFGTLQRNYVWSSGENFWEDIIKKAPTKARAYNNLGNELVKQSKFKEAATCFKHAILLEGRTYADPHVNLGNCYTIMGKLDLAVESYRKTLVVNKYQPDAYNSLGLVLMQQEKYQPAISAFQACLSIVPHYGKALINLARVYIQLQDYKTAWNYLKTAVTNSDCDNAPFAWAHFADLSLELEKYDEALDAYKKLYNLAPNTDNLFKIGVTYYMKKDFQNAAKTFEQGHKFDPLDEKILCNLIECYIKTHNESEALKYLNYCKNKSIFYSGMELHEAQLHLYAGNYKTAKMILESFIKNKKYHNKEVYNLATDILNKIREHESRF